jgi:homoserine dehydrogenase
VEFPVRVRVSIVGLGAVGEWVLRALDRQRSRLRDEHGVEFSVVALATRSDGFVHRAEGIDPAEALAARGSGASLETLAGASVWPDALAGLKATETDILVEVSQSPPSDGEPGLSHVHEALGRGISVATSNKWPIALRGVELKRLAALRGASLRAEATVMSGTPVLSALAGGLGGATALRLRAVLNATVNYICSRLAEGVTYSDALADAERLGLAEPDPSSDVDGFDSAAKLMILAGLVFDVQLTLDDVERRGISTLAQTEIDAARAQGRRIREVATLDPGAGRASVEAIPLAAGDPLFAVEGTTNVIHLEAEPLGSVSISGPGAGPRMAGQGVLADLIMLAGHHAAWRSGPARGRRSPRR